MNDDWEQMSSPHMIDQDEVAKFDELAEKWWDSSGPMAPLHKMNPLRLTWIRDQFCPLTKRSTPRLRPLDGLRLLDLGCGAGLAAEPMAMMGAVVTAIDPSRDSIEAARQHAQKRGARIDYRAMPLEDLVDEGPLFDGVTLLEVIEHVPDQQAFIDLAAALVRPGGILIVSTLSRTAEAYIKAIIAAEYLLGWLPKGTHAWQKFVKPSEMSHMLRRAGLTPVAITGIDYDASRDHFRLCQDPSVNYMMSARKA